MTNLMKINMLLNYENFLKEYSNIRKKKMTQVQIIKIINLQNQKKKKKKRKKKENLKEKPGDKVRKKEEVKGKVKGVVEEKAAKASEVQQDLKKGVLTKK